MTFDPPLPASVPADIAEQIPQQQDLGKWVVLGFAGRRLTHYVDDGNGTPSEYPDVVLSLGPRGGLKCERV